MEMSRTEVPELIRAALARAPAEPGCYLFRDGRGEVIYVGKARSIRTRARSYFQGSSQDLPKVDALRSEAASLEFIVTDSEIDALILESNLIKEHRPRFNVLLRDDKSFPYLKLTLRDEFPRVVLVRRPRSDGQLYFGPFLPASHARRTLRMIPRFFQVANCHLRFDGKQRPCLYYHMDQCLAPCAGLADHNEYAQRVAQAKMFLEGRDEELAGELRQRMTAASDALEFERAARYRDMLSSLERLSERSRMASVGLEAIDFWAEHREAGRATLELFRMREGRVVGRREFTLDPAGAPESLYDEVLPQFYSSADPPEEVVLPRTPADRELLEKFLRIRRGRRVRISAPSRGERRRMLDLVARNAKLAFDARFRSAHVHGVQVMEELRDLLGLEEVPFRIEGFDVSHMQGAEPRASLVVFEGGRPRKAEYRLYKVRSSEEGDDYAAMAEVVSRRYRRRRSAGARLPDLVLIDGGRGQLGAARRALDELGLGDLRVVSLAKREEELFLEIGEEPLLLDRHNPVLRLVQQVRDEAHRFALKHHRAARQRAGMQTSLTLVPGIGELTARRLLQQFGSLRAVLSASRQSLAGSVGPAKADMIVRAREEGVLSGTAEKREGVERGD
jgi:excinuclease ABC subunit C